MDEDKMMTSEVSDVLSMIPPMSDVMETSSTMTTGIRSMCRGNVFVEFDAERTTQFSHPRMLYNVLANSVFPVLSPASHKIWGGIRALRSRGVNTGVRTL